MDYYFWEPATTLGRPGSGGSYRLLLSAGPRAETPHPPPPLSDLSRTAQPGFLLTITFDKPKGGDPPPPKVSGSFSLWKKGNTEGNPAREARRRKILGFLYGYGSWERSIPKFFYPSVFMFWARPNLLYTNFF